MSWKIAMKNLCDTDIAPRVPAFFPYGMESDGRSSTERHVDYCLAAHPKKVLDLGCGDAIWLDSAGERVANIEYVGIDMSKRQIESASRHYNKENIKFIVGDIEETDFGVDEFDVVSSHLVLNFLENPLKSITNIHRAIRPGGALHIAIPAFWRKDSNPGTRCMSRISSHFADFEGKAVPHTGSGRSSFRSEISIRDMLTQAGFQDDNIQFNFEDLVIKGRPVDILSHLTNLMAFAAIDDSDKPRAAAVFLEAAIKEKDTDGNVIFHRPMAFVAAKKPI